MTTREWFRQMRAADWERDQPVPIAIWFRRDLPHHALNASPLEQGPVICDYKDLQAFLDRVLCPPPTPVRWPPAVLNARGILDLTIS